LRKIDRIIITAEQPPELELEQLRNYHVSKGLEDIGYHYTLSSLGVLRVGRRAESPPAPATAFNQSAIAVCLLGAIPIDYTRADLEKVAAPLADLCITYGLYAKQIKESKDLGSITSFNMDSLRAMVQDILDGSERGYYVF